eukprot:9503560-Pyramimonas_sp.AAC.2
MSWARSAPSRRRRVRRAQHLASETRWSQNGYGCAHDNADREHEHTCPVNIDPQRNELHAGGSKLERASHHNKHTFLNEFA